jgi:colanic acid biosynthesis glycosyl transferase WcaI
MLKFVLCGAGPELLVLRSAATALTNVHFLPIQSGDSFPELLNTADIHLLPQREEAADLVLPSKLGGMLASGRPIIAMATAGTGIAEEVCEAGLLVRPGNVTGLTEALCALVENSELRASLGANARSWAVQRWDKFMILRDWERELITFASPHREPSKLAYFLSKVGHKSPVISN